jgi:hypothetical protein
MAGVLLVRIWPALCYTAVSTLKTCGGDGGSHFGGGGSVTDHFFLAPPWWGFFDLRHDPHILIDVAKHLPTSVGVDLTTPAGTWARPWQPPPHFGGGLSLSSGQLAPHWWGCIGNRSFFLPSPTPVGVCPPLPEPHQRGRGSSPSRQPTPWESVSTQINPLRGSPSRNLPAIVGVFHPGSASVPHCGGGRS